MSFWHFIKSMPPQFIWLFIAFGMPVAARILKKLGEQAQKRDAALRKQREELEQLRTGHIKPAAPQAPAPSARATLEEMAARRRAQIEELRQRRASQAGGAATAQPRPQAPARVPAPVVLMPAPQPVPQAQRPPIRQPVPQRPAPARPAQTGDQQRQRAIAKAREQERRALEQKQRASREQAAALAAAAIAAVGESKTQPTTPAPPRTDKRPAMVFTGQDWRRAFVMQELLSPPLALRDRA